MRHKNHSRRAVLAGIAAAPVLAAPDFALSGPDPIFDLIERHRVAHAHRERWLTENDNWISDPISDSALSIEDELERTRPTTLAGVLAIMRYERELRDGPNERKYFLWYEECRFEWLATLEQSIAAIAGEVVS